MITLTLLHPIQSVPVQSWSFDSESVVRIGRSNDNDVIIYSAVVSRHHVELWNHPFGWEIINFGANGTYINDQSITQALVVDGMTIRLGNSGPSIRIRVGATNLPPQPSRPDKKDQTSPQKQIDSPFRHGIIEDDEDGALTQIDLD
ncbi:FHA domain-containing protein [Microcoleus sp.]|uniref:FHA domain-containing protein n=1 Tax=Microcoleus sp. TaxID=44472 RepID=UPI003523CE19